MEVIHIHERVVNRHPELAEDDVRTAWRNAINYVLRITPEKDLMVAVGFDENGRMVEMVAAAEEDGSLLIFHAMTPPSKKTLRELGIQRSRG